MTKILIIGDSHTIALKKEFEEDKEKYSDVICDIVTIGPAAIVRNLLVKKDQSLDVIDELKLPIVEALHKHKDISVLVLLGAEAYNIKSVTKKKIEEFDFCLPDNSEVDANLPYVPYDMVKEVIESYTDQLPRVISSLKGNYFIDINILSGPPLHEETDSLELKIKESFSKNGIEFDSLFTLNQNLRKKLWFVNQNVLESYAHSCNSKLVSFYNKACNENGFLKSEFQHDGIHGNREYARHVLNELLESASVK